jgi:hypothetical protein
MRRLRQAAKVDDNQAQIVKALRCIPGCTVQIIGQPYDLLVGFRGLWHLLEVKDPTKPISDQCLTPPQIDTLAKIRGAAPVFVVKSTDEALAAIGAKEWGR